MTSFAPPEIVRCPACNSLAKRLNFASINLSGGLFPATFQAIARGDVCCPHCGAELDATSLTAIARLDAPWKCGVWAGIPELRPCSI